MELYIGENFRLTSDPMNVMLQEQKWSKPTPAKPISVERWETVGYYANIGQACMALLNKSIKESESNQIHDLLGEITAIQNRITKAVSEWSKPEPIAALVEQEA
jgi:hypothetical protein